MKNLTAKAYNVVTGVQTDEDYPYGFTLRTTIKYWIEYKAIKGFRFVSQTLNPKNGRWNKPKPSTYSTFGFMYKDGETGYINYSTADINGDESRSLFP